MQATRQLRNSASHSDKDDNDVGDNNCIDTTASVTTTVHSPICAATNILILRTVDYDTSANRQSFREQQPVGNLQAGPL